MSRQRHGSDHGTWLEWVSLQKHRSLNRRVGATRSTISLEGGEANERVF